MIHCCKFLWSASLPIICRRRSLVFIVLCNNITIVYDEIVVGRGVAKVVQAKFDAKTLHERPAVAAEARMVDDGSGAKEVFRKVTF